MQMHQKPCRHKLVTPQTCLLMRPASSAQDCRPPRLLQVSPLPPIVPGAVYPTAKQPGAHLRAPHRKRLAAAAAPARGRRWRCAAEPQWQPLRCVGKLGEVSNCVLCAGFHLSPSTDDSCTPEQADDELQTCPPQTMSSIARSTSILGCCAIHTAQCHVVVRSMGQLCSAGFSYKQRHVRRSHQGGRRGSAGRGPSKRAGPRQPSTPARYQE